MLQWKEFPVDKDKYALTPEQRTMLAVEELLKEVRKTNNLLQLSLRKKDSENKIEWNRPQ
jgi:hypothetical protein